jgi:hypothetical protein
MHSVTAFSASTPGATEIIRGCSETQEVATREQPCRMADVLFIPSRVTLRR